MEALKANETDTPSDGWNYIILELNILDFDFNDEEITTIEKTIDKNLAKFETWKNIG